MPVADAPLVEVTGELVEDFLAASHREGGDQDVAAAGPRRAQDLAYAPSKGAINQLTRSLAIEWGPRGINVNAIAPVFTLTAINRSLLADRPKLEWVLSRIPMKRLGELEDLFGPVIFLASDASNFVNGHVLPVDGGWLGA